MQIVAVKASKEFNIRGERLSVLANVSAEIERGRFICLLGPSGCGKSTFLRCVAGLESLTSGQITVGGVPVRGPGPDRAMVFQDYALFPWYTVADNILFGLRLRHIRRRNSKPHDVALQDLLALVGLTGFENAYPHQISGGMRQRVGIARALSVDPDVLLMDEPFAAIDAITRESLQRQLLEVWQKTGKTVLFVTHSVEEATLLGDEVYVFGARPATIRDRITIDLPRPRDTDSVPFVRMAARLRNAIQEGIREAAQ